MCVVLGFGVAAYAGDNIMIGVNSGLPYTREYSFKAYTALRKAHRHMSGGAQTYVSGACRSN